MWIKIKDPRESKTEFSKICQLFRHRHNQLKFHTRTPIPHNLVETNDGGITCPDISLIWWNKLRPWTALEHAGRKSVWKCPWRMLIGNCFPAARRGQSTSESSGAENGTPTLLLRNNNGPLFLVMRLAGICKWETRNYISRYFILAYNICRYLVDTTRTSMDRIRGLSRPVSKLKSVSGLQGGYTHWILKMVSYVKYKSASEGRPLIWNLLHSPTNNKKTLFV